MEFKAETQTQQILRVMQILAWVAFVGFLIQSGAITFSYVFSWLDAEGARNLYQGLNLYNLRQFNFWHFTLTVSFMVAISIMKAQTAWLVIKVLSKINLVNPFTMDVVKKLERISYVIFGMWVVEMVNNGHVAWLKKLTDEFHGSYASSEFIFMAGVVFVISQIFKRGVEIQSENDLTV